MKFYLCSLWNRHQEIIQAEERPVTGLKYQSVAGGFDTEDELKSKYGVANEPCRICGTIFGTSYCEPYKSKMQKLNICFSCNFWQELVESDPNQPKGIVAIVKGVHYMVGDESSKVMPRGFGGSLFNIQWFDGHEAKTTNLWCQGDVPEHFKSKLPDNAEFITSAPAAPRER